MITDQARVQGTAGAVKEAVFEELLADFDAVRVKHAGMDLVEFNDDATYKMNINQVRWWTWW
jgi:hypothetical protein